MICTRRNSLIAFACIATLLPLVLGQSSAGGCGATVTVPDDQDTGPDGTLDETIDEGPVDSDGDGFSDDEELIGVPGTDPHDPTDNPAEVRDSDADGCSDFDELNFLNFCDNDPNTPTSSCQTTYLNADLGVGFDLPSNAELYQTNVEDSPIILGLHWHFLFDGYGMGVGVFVNEPLTDSLADYMIIHNQATELTGSTILNSFPFVLTDGTPAYFTSLISSDGLSTYRVNSFANGYAYEFYSGFPESVPTEAASAYMIAILDSLCID